MSRLSIYLLRDPETFEPKFVGITKCMSIITNHHPSHWGYQKNEHQRLWLKNLVHKGLRPKIELLQRVDRADAEWRRQMIISSLNQLGWPLFNRRDEEAKSKRSKRMRELWSEFEYRRNNLEGKKRAEIKALESYQDSLKNIPPIS